ncbi:ABC transporter ATP-binding protein [Streptomyces adelaidensis]|uniref:ABC transporter ATP-binding protein n=1 Tax=Streptomyces adelaidensis TaxID=2796465 RepID=UPI001902FB76|nr:ABC transporter ATP-binding protein [Streptomyces adelaidensis]
MTADAPDTNPERPTGDATASWRQIARWEWRLLRPERRLLLGWVGGVAAAAVLSVLSAQRTGDFMNALADGDGLRSTLETGAAVGLLAAAAVLARCLAVFCVDLAIGRSCDALGLTVFDELQHKDITACEAMGFDELYHRLTDGTERIREAMRLLLAEFTFYALSACLALVVMVRVDPVLPLICLAVYLPYIGFRLRLLRRFNERWNGHLAEYPALSRVVREAIEGVRTIKIYSSVERETVRLEGAQRRYLEAFRSHQRLLGSGSFLNHVMFLLPEGLVYLYLGRRILDGAVPLGGLFTMTVLFPLLRQFVWHVSRLAAHRGEHGIPLARLEEVRGLPEEPYDDSVGGGTGAAVSGRPRGRIEFRDVSKHLDGVPVLDGLDLTIAPGRRIGVVGLSGAGKSTLANLLVGLLAPDSGEVLVDDRPLAHWSISTLRRATAYVSQDAYLLNDTVRANLGYGIEQPPEDRLLWALGQADLGDFVAALPEGLDTVVGERGIQLSGGQRQRLSLARAFLREPAILVLDETTSALDAAAEARVHRAQQRLGEGVTTLIIAHRLVTVRDADAIVVIDEGRVRQHGTHAELLRDDGLYARLHRAAAVPTAGEVS